MTNLQNNTSDIKSYIVAAQRQEFEALLRDHVPGYRLSGAKVTGRVPWREDQHPSFSADLGKGVWYDHARREGGGVKEFKARLGLNGQAARPQKKIVALYDYRDENGSVLFQAIRLDPKDFRQRRPNGQGGWVWNLDGVRRVLYRLPDVLQAATVYVVEGEKDADRLWALGIPATTNPCGAGTWREEYSKTLAGKHVVIFPDNDDPGEWHAQQVARALLPVAAAVKLVRLPDLAAKGDVSDWLDSGHTREELAEIVKAAPTLRAEDLLPAENGTCLEEQGDPPATDRAVAPASAGDAVTVVEWPTLEEEALYGLAGAFVRAVDPYTEADPVAVLLNVLTAFGNCIGSSAHAKVQHTRHPARLFVAQVGETAKGRKGTGWSTPRYLFSQVDRDWAKDRIKGGLSSGEGLIFNVRDPRWEKQPIKERGRVKDYESVMVDEGEDDRRLMVVEEEFASTLTVMAREGNTLSCAIRQAWDTGDLSILTKNRPLKATNAHIAIIGHITRMELLARMDDTSKGNGFANRFLWALVKRSKELPRGPAVPDGTLLPFVERFQQAIDFARSTTFIQRDEEAEGLWAEVYHDLSSGKPGLFGAVISRAEAQVLRLSLIYALLDCSDSVRVEHLTAALAVWEYCEQSAAYIFGNLIGDPTADSIMEALRQAGTKGMTTNDIHELFQRNQSANERARALNLLQSLGLVKSETKQTGGRPCTVWRIA